MPGAQRTPGGDRWLGERSGRVRLVLATGLLSMTAVVAGTLVAVASDGEPAVTGADAQGGPASHRESPTTPPGSGLAATLSAGGWRVTTTEDSVARAGTATPAATTVAPATATVSPGTTATPGVSPTVAVAGPMDRFALLEALPLPDDAWFEENPAGIDQAYTTAATAQVVIDLHDVYLRADGWTRSAAADGGATWVKGENQVVLELASADGGQVRVYIRVLP